VVLYPYLAFDWTDPFISIAWLASILMLFAGILSFFNLDNHRLWMQIHWIFPISFFFAFLHGKAYLSDNLLEQFLFYIALVFSIISLTSISLKKQIQISCFVTSIHQISDLMFEIGLQQKDIKSSQGFKAGMIVYLRFGKGFSKTWHPFSITSCENNPEIKLLIKNVGQDTSHLNDIRTGDTISILVPFFEFRSSEGRDQLWIAAGVGIAPFLGMMRCFSKEKENRVQLIVFLNNREEILEKELESVQSSQSNFEYKLYYNRMAKSEDLVGSLLKLQNPLVFVCGSKDFMKQVRMDLNTLGINATDIQTEEFF
jgi:predicted ferric reductase